MRPPCPATPYAAPGHAAAGARRPPAPSAATMGRVEAELRALVVQGWAARYRDPLELRARGPAIVAAAPAGSAEGGWGWLLAALGERAAAPGGAMPAALAEAEAAFAQARCADGLAVCRALRALPLCAAGQGDAAEALVGDLTALAVPVGALQAHAAQFTHFARAMARSVAGRWDDVLRDRYTALQCARITGDDGAIAHALADLAAQQNDLSNAEDALRLATEAVRHAERAGRSAAWLMAAMNRLSTLLTLERHDEAAAAARALRPQMAQMHPRNRETGWLLLARAHLHGGDTAGAGTQLQQAEADRQVDHRLEWTVAAAELALAEGDAARAAGLCEGFLAARAAAPHARAPGALRLLHRAAAAAHEQLGDAAAALRHARAEHALFVQVTGRGAQARRLTLEIEHQLDRERWHRAQAEAERARLDNLNHALEAANAAKTRFLAAASHDLRQPVQALALNMAALEHERVSPAQGQLVQRMARSLDALVQMFDVLLDISRLDAGAVGAELRPLALPALLRRLVDEHAAAAAARGLALRLRLPAGDAAGLTDPVLLERCLRNLLDNALKYTPRGGVLLALRPWRGDWRIEVVDSGIGMPPAVLAQAFDEFFQADNPERDRARGLGLGLAIVQRLVRLMGHPFALHSRPDRGTRAVLTLPRHAAAAPPPAAVATAPAPAALCLAVIDDDADVRDGLVALLERWGHRVLHGADDEAVLVAWHGAGRPPVQALVCDLRLRGTRTGVQAVAALRATWGAATPALVVTGDVAPDRLQLLRASGLPWLPKPVMPMRLRSWLAGVPAAR